MSEVKFERENRYIVIKRSDLDKLYKDPTKYATTFGHALALIAPHLPKRKFLVIESDWPEYEPVWEMIQQRMTGEGLAEAETMGYSVIGNRYMIALTQQEILDHSQSYAGCMFELVARSALDAQRLRADIAQEQQERLREAWLSMKTEFDAQRLRADTAEDELKREKEFHAVNVAESERMLSAAEQRIEKLTGLIEEFCQRVEAGEVRSKTTYAKFKAALNPNPEAESHATDI